MKLKYSKYNYLFEKKGELYLYNTKTSGKLILTQDDEKKFFYKIKEEGAILDNKTKIYYENGFFVDDYIDEFKSAFSDGCKKMYDKNKLNLIIMPTRDCDLSCIYCYEKHEKKYMTLEKANEIILAIEDYYSKNHFQYLCIEWFGGEPLLCMGLIEQFMIKLKAFCHLNNIVLYSSMTTNAHLLDKVTFDKLIYLGIVNYQITLDGLKETHDKLRITSNGEGTWNRILQSLLLMKDSNHVFTCTIRTNYDLKVLFELQEYIEYINKMILVDRRFKVLIHSIGDYGENLDNRLELINEKLHSSSTKLINEILIKNKVNMEKHSAGMHCYGQKCYASRLDSLVIDYDGTLRKCTVIVDDDINNVGEVVDGKFFFNENKVNLWVIPPIFAFNNKCRNCKCFPICFGGACPISYVKLGDKATCTCLDEIDEEIMKTITIEYMDNKRNEKR